MEMHSGCGGQIPVEEVVDRLDQLLERDLTGEAEDHLYSWLEKARDLGDWQGEGIGLIQSRGMEKTVTGATTFLNAATTMKAFGDPEGAIPWYEKAEKIYNRSLQEGDYRFAGLYNNLALAWTDLGK